jgi:hypothetical protein
MRKLALYSIILLASFALVFGLSGNVHAIPFCEEGSVEGAIECADGPGGDNHFDGEDILGISGWMEISKDESLGDLEISSGTFAFDGSLWDDYDNLLVILKDGASGFPSTADPSDQIKWFAYLLDFDYVPDDGLLSWDYPGVHNISYLALWGTTSTSVPDASVMLLLGSSLLGLWVFGRMSKKS